MRRYPGPDFVADIFRAIDGKYEAVAKAQVPAGTMIIDLVAANDGSALALTRGSAFNQYLVSFSNGLAPR
jgi:hypothetical protein